jgi:general secretion pathway protein G
MGLRMQTGRPLSSIGSALSVVICPWSFVLCHLSVVFGRDLGGLVTERSKGQRTNDQRQVTTDDGRPSCQAFTLLELMVALSVVMILASFAIPAYYIAIQRAREAVLRQDLYTLRSLIDEFTVDKQHPPASLQELVEAGYLRGGIPVDPITGSSESWHVDIEDVPGPDQTQPGVVDVHSGSDDTALDGTPYNSW